MKNDTKMTRVLHITAHLGGGVGKVLSQLSVHAKKTKSEYCHEIILLEEPEQTQFIDVAKAGGIEVQINPDYKNIITNMVEADIVQLEWWHHPKMAEFLFSFPAIPLRLIIWSHISGCFPPVIRSDFIKMSSRFLFSSPVSLESHYLKNEENLLNRHSDVVYSSGGFDDVRTTERIPHQGFNIGYIGTLNFCKLHPDFIDFCANINIPDARFILVGDNTIAKDQIVLHAIEKGLINQFEFVGYTPQVINELARFDVFGYPLNPEHYGTTENALLEAMAYGIPPVVLSQSTEKYLVNHMETGMLVKDKEEYGAAMRYLYERPDERIRLGGNAREYVLREFSIEKTVQKLHHHYQIVMKTTKKIFSYKNILGDTPADWFLSCLGKERNVFEKSMKFSTLTDEIIENERQIMNCKQLFKERNKSSVYHFYRYFTKDPWLKYWVNILEKSKKKEN